MPVLPAAPEDRDPATIATLASYRPGALIWIYRSGAWRPGVVLQQSDRAAIVRYRPTQERGVGVDTATAADLVARTDPDPFLDGTASSDPVLYGLAHTHLNLGDHQ